MQPAYERPNWIVASISLGAFGAILVILFAVMSGPFGDVTDMIGEQSENFNVSGSVDPFLTMIATVFGTVFALAMIGLIAWFFLGSQREEHDDYVSSRHRPPGGDFQ